MMDTIALFPCLQPPVTAPTRRQLRRIALALLVMTGRLTMLGMARWTGKGGRYRPVQRGCATIIPWAMLFWGFFRHPGHCPDEVSLVAGDAVLVTKAGKTTHGLDRVFSRWYGKPVPGLAFFTLSRVRVQQRRSFPLRVAQVVRSDAEKAASKAKAAAKKPHPSTAQRPRGRPKGSKHTNQAAVPLTPECRRVTALLDALRTLMAGVSPLTS
jgi:putative transposase